MGFHSHGFFFEKGKKIVLTHKKIVFLCTQGVKEGRKGTKKNSNFLSLHVQ